MTTRTKDLERTFIELTPTFAQTLEANSVPARSVNEEGRLSCCLLKSIGDNSILSKPNAENVRNHLPPVYRKTPQHPTTSSTSTAQPQWRTGDQELESNDIRGSSNQANMDEPRDKKAKQQSQSPPSQQSITSICSVSLPHLPLNNHYFSGKPRCVPALVVEP